MVGLRHDRSPSRVFALGACLGIEAIPSRHQFYKETKTLGRNICLLEILSLNHHCQQPKDIKSAMQAPRNGKAYAEVAAVGLLRSKMLPPGVSNQQLLRGVGGEDTEPPPPENSEDESDEPSRLRKAADWVRENPGTTVCYGVSAGSLVVLAAPALVAAPALGLAGFGSQGIVAGSTAAGIQAGIGNVVAPSLFATLQSAGAAGYGAAVVNGAIQAGAGVSATAFAWWGAKKKDCGENGKEEEVGGDKKPSA
ncbi:uncharacterized protein CCOS01_14314 [Colletotrichum costaricense]|uniref:Interferon-induced 6-16 n=1 Tax=Colletotrichum costaricense TaxID=1209916 RepID=A0AAJ0DUB7_9PEZI|nr:uncharacterized protein CCOS01_14314 [Colletotrichum costaricense]KAK1513372.1 hypothetical protein CCOS01_14314 [Colletotrichum costaricense]